MQDFIKEGAVGYILERIDNNERELLPPTPVVRDNPDGNGYIVIDGHNLMVVYYLFGENFDVYLAGSSDDELNELPRSTLDAVAKRNKDLSDKYDFVVEEVAKLKIEGICNFGDLVKKYSFLSSLDSAREYYRKKGFKVM